MSAKNGIIHSYAGMYHKKQCIQFGLLIPNETTFRPNFGYAGCFCHFAETFLPNVVFFECLTASNVVPTDFRWNLGSLVFKYTVQLQDSEINAPALPDSLNSILVYSDIKGALSNVIALLGLIDCQVVL